MRDDDIRESALRESLLELLSGGHAHAAAKAILSDLDDGLVDVQPSENIHSIWQEIEHLRLAQHDILQYTVQPRWKSAPWPEGFWPKDRCGSPERFQESVAGFLSDLERLVALTRDRSIDLTSVLPHGDGKHTYLRELLLAADHNAYHLGQIVQLRKMLANWP